MAISKIKPRHASEGKTIAQILKDRLDYNENPDKTRDGLLVKTYQCNADTAWKEFTVSKQIYTSITGRTRKPKEDVISYLLIQSFKSGEITPEDATELGYQLAMEFTEGQHQFVVATHTDRHHIHCHIEFNARRWTVPTSSTITKTPTGQFGKSATDCARSMVCLSFPNQRKRDSTMRNGRMSAEEQAGRRRSKIPLTAFSRPSALLMIFSLQCAARDTKSGRTAST